MVLNAQTLEGTWNEVKGKLRSRWSELTDSDLQGARGNVEQLVGIIQRKTGETRAAIMDYLDELTADGASAVSNAAESVRDYLQSASETVRDRTQTAMRSVQGGYRQTEEMVRQRPVESMALCFGAGVLAGVLAAILLRSK